MNAAFERFKQLADKKHEIFDADLQALVTEAAHSRVEDQIKLISLEATSSSHGEPAARVTLQINGEERQARAGGDGPVDAIFDAIEQMIESGAELLLYSVNSVSRGTDAQGEVTVRLSRDGRVVNGQGADTDVVIASARAYVNALNRLLAPDVREHPQYVRAV